MALIRIEGARVINPSTETDEYLDILLEDGIIKAVEKPGSFGKVQKGEILIKAKGMWVMPGLVDMHVHLREPGEEYKEDIATGLKAAARAGLRAVCCMPNTNPPNDTRAITEMILRRAKAVGGTTLYPVGAITVAREGKIPTEMGELLDAGAVAFSDDGRTVAEPSVMRRAMEYALSFDALIIEHPEEPSLTRGGVSHEGRVGTMIGLGGMPAEAEEIIVSRDIILARLTGARVHFAHISTKGAVELIKKAKDDGIKITAEVTPHHLLLNDTATIDYDTNTKVNPPLRSEEHRATLMEAIKDGIIDVIASDHAPHSMLEKEGDFISSSFGISGIETIVPLIVDLVNKGWLSPVDMARVMSLNPHKILKIEGGEIKPGSPAYITIIDPEAEHEINPDNFISKGKNTPFAGWKLRGKAVLTINEGKIISDENSLCRS